MKADCANNNNKFYIIQVLKNKGSAKTFFYTRYGRVGDSGVSDLVEIETKNAVKEYQKKLKQKQSSSKGYTIIDMKLGKTKNEDI